ncbi:MAG: hypothetical protein CL846_00735 [Crocinitomicaceae bacterium]|nr:hypothetical protein [Crocinitomicaceae bacterium]|tara:strand:- start:5550 stop:6221 length:672 start_codon:yes stop_codon:yes gene_type:complete
MKNLTITLCFALLCSVGVAQTPSRKAPSKNNMVKEKASSEEKIKPTSSKYPTKPGVSNEEKRATSPANTMVKEKPSSSVESKNKYPTKPGVSNEEKRVTSPANTMVKSPAKPSAPTSSKGDKLQDKTSKSTPGKTDKKYTPNAPTSTTGNVDSETRSGGAPSGNSFCTGWEAGYSKGFTKVHPEGHKPEEVPQCPSPSSGCEDYKCGYDIGTKAGQIDAKKQR